MMRMIYGVKTCEANGFGILVRISMHLDEIYGILNTLTGELVTTYKGGNYEQICRFKCEYE